jgi:hypothetical protein
MGPRSLPSRGPTLGSALTSPTPGGELIGASGYIEQAGQRVGVAHDVVVTIQEPCDYSSATREPWSLQIRVDRLSQAIWRNLAIHPGWFKPSDPG